jgi:predicted Zn-dependent protease
VSRWLALAAIVGALIVSLVVAERRKAAATVGAQAILTAVASAERDATRIPARVTRLPDAEEIDAGDRIAAGILASGSAGGTPAAFVAAEACVQRVGAEVARSANRGGRMPYRFHLLPDPAFVNAFAVPGGHVFIGAGLLSVMESEDELAAVLGHEIAHIDDYHAAERLQTERTLGTIPVAGAIASIPIEIVQAGYSKEQELEADRDGTALEVAAGYSSSGAVRMLDAFARREPAPRTDRSSSPAQEAGQIATGLLAGYFRSHPYAVERAAAIRRLSAERKWATHQERAPSC